MKIERENSTWLYTVTDDAGGRKVLPSVTNITNAALNQFAEFTPAMMERVRIAGEFGKAVHSLTALDDQGTLDEDALDLALAPILTAWRKFKAEHKPVLVCSEHMIASRLGYAGTLDRIAEMGGKTVLLEIKSRPYKAGRDGLQTIAYAKAYEEMSKAKIAKRYIIELKRDGSYTLTETKDARDWDMFRSCLAIYNWRKAHGT